MKVVILSTVEEQLAAGEREPVRPEGVKAPESVTLTAGYDYKQPPIGTVHNIRVEDGRLVGDVDLDIGWAGLNIESHHEGERRVIDSFDLIHVALLRQPARPRG